MKNDGGELLEAGKVVRVAAEVSHEVRPLVLVVENDFAVSTCIRENIEARGFRARCADNGSEALSVIEAERPTLMLVNLVMPIINGVDFLKIVKRSPTLSTISRVILTATNDLMISVKENASVLYKPIDLETLTGLLLSYCASPRGIVSIHRPWAAS